MRLNPYRIMWLMVFFDLPTTGKKEIKDYTRFRKNLMKDGFSMMQYSVYLRHCASRENAEIHAKRVKSFLPPRGQVNILRITDKQFELIETFAGRRSIPPPLEPQQLEMF
ncbi:CRISPR-associated endonuclease Cas2 [bacterium]|nr:CRISPR-associated endonuclease Cas2 [bacterium]MBU1634457.1 CRISPR-associated endonuclease Cas2 [bacterium]MBU1872873.1 CRISPR-associated endonuclease Cas2 [bacterium]